MAYARMLINMWTALELATLDNHHFQYLAGFYDEETWQGFRAQLKGFVSSDLMARLLIQKRDDFFRTGFREHCQAQIAAGAPDGSYLPQRAIF